MGFPVFREVGEAEQRFRGGMDVAARLAKDVLRHLVAQAPRCISEVGRLVPAHDSRSQMAFIQPVSVAFALSAARWYLAFSAGVTRRLICAMAGSTTGGLPLGRLGLGSSMSRIIAHTNIPCNPHFTVIYCPYTNHGGRHERTPHAL